VIKQLNLDYDVTVDQIFQSSKRPLIVIKKNNDMIFSIIKQLIANTFDKKGVFETIWLSIIHWHKLKVANLRSLLKVNREEDEFDPQHIMRQSIKSSLMNKNSPDEAQQITKYATKAGFNIELTSSGIK